MINIISYTKKGGELNQKLCDLLVTKGFDLRSYRHIEKQCVEFYAKYSDTYTNLSDGKADGCNDGSENVRTDIQKAVQMVRMAFENKEAILFIGAAGIAVRSIAPYVKDKFTDPPILVLDEMGQYVISLLSGHMGGANDLARIIAKRIGGQAVITTATDINHIWAVDEWAKKNNLTISDRELAKKVSAKLLAGEELELVSGYLIKGEVPQYLRNPKSDLSIYITNRNFKKSTKEKEILRLIPRNLCLGVGCRKDISTDHMLQAFEYFIEKYYLEEAAFHCIATIDRKKDEEAILALANRLQVKIRTFTTEELERIDGEFAESNFVKETVGVGNVCERAAKLVYDEPMIPKESLKGVTFAVTYDKREFVFEI